MAIVNVNSKMNDLCYVVNQFRAARYLAFDYCYLYFRTSSSQQILDNMELSCLHLFSYLANWGMVTRGNPLIKSNYSALKPIIEYIASCPSYYWNIDVDMYEDKVSVCGSNFTYSDLVLRIYNEIKEKLESSLSKIQNRFPPLNNSDLHVTDTMVTKIMLGVFGMIPAFDRNFKAAMPVSMVCKRALASISKFYKNNREEIICLQKNFVVHDSNGTPTRILYSKAKIIDMYGFLKGGNGNNNNNGTTVQKNKSQKKQISTKLTNRQKVK